MGPQASSVLTLRKESDRYACHWNFGMLNQKIGCLRSDFKRSAPGSTEAAVQPSDDAGVLPVRFLFAAMLLLMALAISVSPMLNVESGGSAAEQEQSARPIRVLFGALTASDDEVLALTSEGRLEAFNLLTGLPIADADFPRRGVLAAHMSGDGQTLAYGFINGTLQIDRKHPEGPESLTVHCGSTVDSVLLSSDGELVIADTVQGPPRLYDTRTGKVHIDFPATIAEVIAISPNDALLAAIGSENCEIQLFSMADGTLVGRTLGQEPIRTACFSSSGSAIIVGTVEGSISCRTVPTLKERWTAEASRDSIQHYPCSAIAIARQVVAVELGFGRLCLFDLGTGELLGARDGHVEGIANLFFSKNGRRLICISHDGRVRVRSTDRLADLWQTELIGIGHNRRWSAFD